MRYLPEFLNVSEADTLSGTLLGEDTVTWRTEQFRMYGKRIPVPRQVAWCGDAGLNYRYTGADHMATGWLPCLTELRGKIQQEAGFSVNFVLLNRYLHGKHHMGWHRDNESGTTPMIASLSLGAVRRFRLRDDSDSGDDETIDLANGSLLVFDGRQSHMLAKTNRQVGARVNLTFRYIQSESALHGC